MDRRRIQFPAKDDPLRADIRTLGSLLGEVLIEQGGNGFYDTVEGARLTAIRFRTGEEGARQALISRLQGLDLTTAEDLIYAFSTYFQLANLAEKIHRIRRRRDYLRTSDTPQPGSIHEAMVRLKAQGHDLPTVHRLLAKLHIEPVFTAHPTQASRRSLLQKQQQIGRRLFDRLDPARTPQEERAALGAIRNHIATGWQTEAQPSQQRTVQDELEYVGFFLSDVIYEVIPAYYEGFEDALTKVYGPQAQGITAPQVLSFASWVGGDMDGNPNVGADTIAAALDRQHEWVITRYRRELKRLYRDLSQSSGRVPVSDEVAALIADYRQRLPTVEKDHPSRHANMPYRLLVRLIDARLEETLRRGQQAYPGPQALLDDLQRVAASLSANRGQNAGLFWVRRLIRRIETFGFHLATIDIRQHAGVHRRVLGQALGLEDWSSREPQARQAVLREHLAKPSPPSEPSPELEDVLSVFKTVREYRQRYGAAAVGPYIISMAEGADDVLAVLLLATWAGLADDRGHIDLDIAPLFETVADLNACGAIMAELYDDPRYAAHLAARDNRQIIMLGYSDSGKDGGIAASRWAIQRAQEDLVAVTEQAEVEINLFHGRGGTISRGGDKTHRAVLSSPPGSVRGRLRVTEQGEIIAEKFGLRGIAIRSLEQATASVMLASVTSTAGPMPPNARQIMSEIAEEARRAYRALVYEDPRFERYFRQASPIDVIERMPIGSRPSSRGKRAIEDLRAIPWVFSWTQNRHLLPGWYGVGTALDAAITHHGSLTLRALTRDWPYMSTLLEDIEMVLAKADMEIAARYAALADDEAAGIFALIRQEFELTVSAVLRLRGESELLAGDSALGRAIRLRNPYLDPISLLQVELLQRWRAGGRTDDAILRVLKGTISGISQGMQNTG